MFFTVTNKLRSEIKAFADNPRTNVNPWPTIVNELVKKVNYIPLGKGTHQQIITIYWFNRNISDENELIDLIMNKFNVTYNDASDIVLILSPYRELVDLA